MSRERNIKAQERFAEGVNSGEFELFDEVVAPDAVDHDPAPDQGRGPEGFKRFFSMMRNAFPDLEVTPERMTATDEDVALAYTIRGTHRGEFQGVAPTGKKIEVRGCQIGRFDEDGKLAERWGSSDELGVLRQLDAVNIRSDEENKGFMDRARDALSGNQ